MFRSPEKNQDHPEKERRRYYKFLTVVIATALLFIVAVEDIRLVDTDIYPANQPEFVIEIPEGVDREAKSLLIARSLVADMEVSADDLPPEGGTGVLGQVVYDISEAEFNQRYKTDLQFSPGPHHLAILSYFMLKDNGAQTADIIFGDKVAIRVTDFLYDAFDFVTPTVDTEDSHRFDIETTVFLLIEKEPGKLEIEKLLTKNHSQYNVYKPEVLRFSGTPLKIKLVMSRGKHAIYPSKAACRNGRFNLLHLVVFSADVCDPDIIIPYEINSEDLVGEPGNTRNPIEDNPDFVLFPEGSDARKNFGRAKTAFIR